MDVDEFSDIIYAAFKSIPERILKRLSNISIVIQDYPNTNQIKNIKEKDAGYFGMFETLKVSKADNSEQPPSINRIIFFKASIEDFAKDKTEVMSIVSDVLKSEIENHFGMDAQILKAAHKNKSSDLVN